MAAAIQKDEKLAKMFKDKLYELSCPYTDGVDDAWILDLVFSPGEPRLRLLFWLFSKLDSKLNDLLDPQSGSSETKMDSRVQRLLYVSSLLGLSDPNDVDLIRGVKSGPMQVSFMSRLVDWVLIVDRAENSLSRSIDTSRGPSGRQCYSRGRPTSLRSQVTANSLFVDSLAEQQRMDNLFPSRISLIPPDIVKQLELDTRSNIEKTPVPDLERLAEEASSLYKDLQRQNEILAQIKKKHDMPSTAGADQKTEMLNQTLKLVLSDLDQLVLSFSCCYENEMTHWCAKTSAPQLTGAGVCFKRVHTMLQQFRLLLSSIQSSQLSHCSLTSDLRRDVSKLKSDLARISEQRSEQRSASNNGNRAHDLIESLNSSVYILEESINHLDSLTSHNSTTTSLMTSRATRC